MVKSRVFAFAASLLFLAADVLACPLCSDALNDGHGPNQLARGFAWSIGALLLVPMLLVGGGAIGIWRAAQRHRNMNEEGEPEISD